MPKDQPPPPPAMMGNGVEPEGRPSGRAPADKNRFQVEVKPEVEEMLAAAAVDMGVDYRRVAAMVITPANIKDVRDRFVEQFG